MPLAPEPTAEQRAVIDAATWQPITRDEGQRVVLFGDLRANLDGYPLAGGRTARAGGLYQVYDRYPATTSRMVAVVLVDEAAGPRWYRAEVGAC